MYVVVDPDLVLVCMLPLASYVNVVPSDKPVTACGRTLLGPLAGYVYVEPSLVKIFPMVS